MKCCSNHEERIALARFILTGSTFFADYLCEECAMRLIEENHEDIMESAVTVLMEDPSTDSDFRRDWIANRAYFLSLEEPGGSRDHWLQAEQEYQFLSEQNEPEEESRARKFPHEGLRPR